MDLYEYSVVNFLRDHTGGRCGYCGATDTNYSRGMWAYRLTCIDYELLIDRGLRRSGKYVYKPSMDVTCCPCYSIKCAALDFKLTRPQRKILNRMYRYLKTGEKRPSRPKLPKYKDDDGQTKPSSSWLSSSDDDSDDDDCEETEKSGKGGPFKGGRDKEGAETKGNSKDEQQEAAEPMEEEQSNTDDKMDTKPSKKKNKTPRPGDGIDPSKPLCKKAKQLRKERKLAKLAARQKASSDVEMKETETEIQDKSEGTSVDPPPSTSSSSSSPAPTSSSKPKNSNSRKTLQDYLDEHNALGDKGKHKLEVTLVRSQPKRFEFNSTFDESYALYKKYQMAIHKDKPHQCSVAQYTRFLVESPIQEEYKSGYPKHGFGSFHQHYRIDGKLVAVGVLDLLPHSVSSVYFYYDPDYEFLSLGNYSALREIAYTQELHKKWKDIEHYFMGYYIHDCVKMRYKGRFHPSYVLCPIAYNWVPVEIAFPKLDKEPYCRLDETDKEDEPYDKNKVLIFYERMIMPYHVYQLASQMGEYYTDDVENYARTVGKRCSEKLLLLLH